MCMSVSEMSIITHQSTQATNNVTIYVQILAGEIQGHQKAVGIFLASREGACNVISADCFVYIPRKLCDIFFVKQSIYEANQNIFQENNTVLNCWIQESALGGWRYIRTMYRRHSQPTCSLSVLTFIHVG